METTTEAIRLLVEIVREPVKRKSSIVRFQTLIWENRNPSVPTAVWNVLKELAHDLDYFEINPNTRHEDPAYYGHKRLEDEVLAGLKKLSGFGLTIPSDIL